MRSGPAPSMVPSYTRRRGTLGVGVRPGVEWPHPRAPHRVEEGKRTGAVTLLPKLFCIWLSFSCPATHFFATSACFSPRTPRKTCLHSIFAPFWARFPLKFDGATGPQLDNFQAVLLQFYIKNDWIYFMFSSVFYWLCFRLLARNFIFQG